MDNMPGMTMSAPAAAEDPVDAANRLAWKKESESNHHLVGLFVLLAGIFILAESHLLKRWSWVRYAWPMCFVVSGLFVLVYSDTEIWPFGPQTPWYALTHQVEDLQHKIFAPYPAGSGLRRTPKSARAMEGALDRMDFSHNSNGRSYLAALSRT